MWSRAAIFLSGITVMEMNMPSVTAGLVNINAD
jgi:hypothetical protein